MNKDTHTHTHTRTKECCCCWCLVTKSCPRFCDPMDYRPPGSSVQGIPQTRIEEWVAISFSRRSSRLRDWTYISRTGRQILYHGMTREARNEILIDHKKEQSNTACSNMDKPRDYCMMGTKSDTERQIPSDITYMWNLKYDAVELFMKQKKTQT